MKYKIRKTNEIVDVVGYSACTHTRFPESDYVCYIDDEGNEIVGRGLNLIWDFGPINEESANDFDWQSFRAEAAKDILCAMVPVANNIISTGIVNYSIKIADELIKQLQNNELHS